jgi:hypothetical protein
MGGRRRFVGCSKQETTMTPKTISRLVRLGAARKLTRSATDGDFVELNSPERYDIPASA